MKLTRISAALLLLWGMSVPAIHAQPLRPVAPEYQVKAAIVYNLAKFVEWSPEDRGPLIFVVIGKDPFGATLDETLRGKNVNGRGLLVRRINGIQDLQPCHLLFISSSERSRVREILQAAGVNVLTLGEMEQFARLGGMISFVIEESKVRFEINVDALACAGIKVSSRLLQLAKVVRSEAAKR
jgi:hypothetical protein